MAGSGSIGEDDRLPDFLREFFGLPWTKVAVIRGGPGTGKTALALTISEWLVETGREVIYSSSDVSEERLAGQFPWIRDLLGSGLSVRAGPVRAREPRHLPLIFYEHVEEAPDAIVIDSWNSFTYELDERDALRAARSVSEMTRKYGGKVVLIEEGDGWSPLDYVADVLIGLDRTLLGGRVMRKVTLEKVRGLGVSWARSPFTLAGGRFRILRPRSFSPPPRGEREPFPPADLSRDRLPPGVAGMDEILGGGWRRGTVNLIKLGPGAGVAYMPLLANPIMAFLNGGGAYVSILSGRFSPESVVDVLLGGYVPDVEDRVAFAFPGRYRYSGRLRVLSPEGESAEEFLIVLDEAEEAMRARSGDGSIIWFVGLDSLEWSLGMEGALRAFRAISIKTRTRGDLCFAVSREDQLLPGYVADSADTLWEISSEEGVPILYGLNPHTGAFGVEADYSGPLPRAEVIPIL